MAIILPNTRNALGVPNRYSDLAAAGLRYTPPPVYRYDAYDVQGDEATLYEEDIDLADYQYNVDNFDATVVPAGYAAVCGVESNSLEGNFLIGTDSRLYYRDTGGIILPTGSPSGVTRVAFGGFIGLTRSCLVIVSGDLHAYQIINGEAVSYLIDNTREWTEISFCARLNDPRCFAIGVADGKLMAVHMVSGDFYVHTLISATGWTIAGGVSGSNFHYASNYGSRLSSLVISQSGYLHQVSASSVYEGDSFLGEPSLSSQLNLGTGWQQVSGYMREFSIPDGYQGTSPLITTASRMYGIQNGFLFSFRHALTLTLDAPSKTQITEFADWWRVTFITLDEAVAIRRIAL